MCNELFIMHVFSLQAGSSDECGVIYVGHIPRGFYEPQMKKYFSQFGNITRLKLSRSKRVKLIADSPVIAVMHH